MTPRPRPLVLVVEDAELNRTLAEKYLRVFGFDVAVAEDGFGALDAVHETVPSLILMDLSLPELDGWETLRRLRLDRRTRRVPVVAVTAHAMSGDRERILAAGFDAYLSKPYEPEELRAVVERFVH